jgi:hypothetical protein
MTSTHPPDRLRTPESRRPTAARVRGLASIAAKLAAAIWFIAGPASSLMAQDETKVAADQKWRLVGVGSCTAAGCHGAGHTDRTAKSEYNFWISQDSHSHAFSNLYNEQSRRMTQLLSQLSSEPTPPAPQNPRCLACHSMTDASPLDPHTDVLSDGVGCEACHGPAEGWLAVHSEHRLNQQEKRQFGMWDTDRLLVRTQVCVRCHVGSPPSGNSPSHDVNHDLIAAGHPRLRFEMTSFSAIMPKHWDGTQDRARHPNFDAQLWAVGQAATTQAALSQLASRAQRGTNWPEFAEWSCGACHHDLRGDETRQSRLADRGGLSGRHIAWDPSNYYAARQFAPEINQAFGLGDTSAAKIQSGLTHLDDQMQTHNPDRRKIALAARQTADDAGTWTAALERASLDRPRLDQLTQSIVARQAADGVYDWPTAAQFYNALASLHQSRLQLAAENAALRTPADDRITAALAQFYTALAAKDPAQTRDELDSETIHKQFMDFQQLLAPERTAP